MSEPLKWTGYLAISVNRAGVPASRSHLWRTAARMSVGKPSLKRDEVAVKVSVELPVSLFEEPQLEARISVPEHAVTPLTIDMETLDNVAALIAQNTGFTVNLVPVDPSKKTQ